MKAGPDPLTSTEWAALLAAPIRGLFSFPIKVAYFAVMGPPKPAAPPAPPPAPKIIETEKVIDWVKRYKRRYGAPPMTKVVQAEFGLSWTTSHRRIRAALAVPA